ncbi:MAG: ABC transporter permease [Myxococcales bacterium]|nr:ABC transporter permease [Myxococcales bacterium]
MEFRKRLRAFRASMKIGWKIESNWTSAPLYLLYAAIRPLSLCVLLYFLFKVVSAAPSADPRFLAIFVGNAIFSIFGTLAGGLSWAIISDREHYQLIRYVYIAPTPFIWKIFGRAVTFVLVALSSVALIIAVGAWWLHLPIGWSHIHWLYLLAMLALGLPATLALGLFFAGLLLVTARHAMLLAEGVGGTLLLICGVLYPTSYLPAWLRPLAWASPLTYWIEGCRRAFGVVGFDRHLVWMPDWLLVLVLALLTALTAVASYKAFNRFEHYAKRHGKIDQTTNY